jgi:hypothetical protein
MSSRDINPKKMSSRDINPKKNEFKRLGMKHCGSRIFYISHGNGYWHNLYINNTTFYGSWTTLKQDKLYKSSA